MEPENQKVPSQIFKWFERMKSNYEQSVQTVLQQFERNNATQQARLDKSHTNHIEQLKAINDSLSSQYNKQINQLQEDIIYYREQMSKQQETINELHSRYNNIVMCVLPKEQNSKIKDIFSEDDFVSSINKSIEDKTSITFNDVNSNYLTIEEQNSIFEQAIIKRNNGDIDEAFILFEQAAKLGHAKSMGAMGRSFFLGEGTHEDPCIGLAWLINAANLSLPQAIDRVKHFTENDPQLYEEAKLKSCELI